MPTIPNVFIKHSLIDYCKRHRGTRFSIIEYIASLKNIINENQPQSAMVTVTDTGLARLKLDKKHELPRCGNDHRNDEGQNY